MTRAHIGSKKELALALTGAHEFFMNGNVRERGIGFNFAGNRAAFIQAIGTLRLDMLLDEEPSHIEVAGVTMTSNRSFNTQLAGSNPNLRGLSLTEMLDVLQSAGVRAQGTTVAASVLIGHKAEQGVSLDAPLVELASRWNSVAFSSATDKLLSIEQTVQGYSGAVESTRIRLLADAVRSGEHTIAAPSQEYRIKIGGPAIDLSQNFVLVDQWYNVSV
jgi:hypothetical protein